jgi:hypothetical protein
MHDIRRGYPIGALFVVVTASAVLVAGASPLIRLAFRGEVEIPTVLAALALGAGWGLLIGGVTGILQFRSALGGLVGAGAGTLIGAAAGLIARLPASELTAATAAMTAGSALIIAVALLTRQEAA